ncbi:MAG TPA: 50S ribosomal protein L10 [archaeon]|nr:50S ribosomal protein L10 [archaeon]
MVKGKAERQEKAGQLADSFKSAKTLAVANIGRLPSRNFQLIRRELRDKADIRVVKRTLLKKALEKAGSPIKEAPAQATVILTDIDPFELSRILKGLRRPFPAKVGMIAGEDIIVREGGTGLPPGQDIGDLQAVGVPSKIERGQIVVLKDHLILKQGQKVTAPVAKVLNKLGIKPFEVGLEIEKALFEGLVFGGDVLNIDSESIRANMKTAVGEAFRMAFNLNYPTPDVIKLKAQKASTEAKALAMKLEWVTGDTVKALVSKANAQAQTLESRLGMSGGET